jgi:plastocyanin
MIIIRYVCLMLNTPSRGILMRTLFLLLMILPGVFAIDSTVFAAGEDPVILAIHNSQFEPKQLALPAGNKVRLVVRNQDGMPAEFESYDLSREVVVPGHGEAAIYIGPLGPGTYRFFNDFNHDMQGLIVVEPDAN